jgi:hypothetical protein
VKGRLERTHLEAEKLGDLFVGESFDLTQQDDGTVTMVEAEESSLQAAADLDGRREALRTGLAVARVVELFVTGDLGP